jgi:hypothetical protein
MEELGDGPSCTSLCHRAEATPSLTRHPIRKLCSAHEGFAKPFFDLRTQGI